MDNLYKYKVYEFEEFRLDAAHLLLYHKNEEVPLAPRAIETLLALLERRGEVVTKDELMDAIWTDTIVEESNLWQYLHLLRKTLGKQLDGKPYIETLKRRGYRFNGDVTVRHYENGTAPRGREGAKGNKQAKSEQDPWFQRTLRVQKRGNVLALADWIEAKNDHLPEPSASAHAADTTYAPAAPDSQHRLIFAAALAVALLVTTGLSIAWFRSASAGGTLPVKSELTFLNLTNGEYIDDATISPDGNYFVYASHDGEKAHLWLQQTGQVNRVEITEPFAGGISGTSFTPDSRFVCFVGNEGRAAQSSLYRVPTLGGPRIKILDDIAAAVSFSPDGNEMSFVRDNRRSNRVSMIIASSDGTRERVLLTRTGKDAESINGGGAWSPDGKTIAFGSVDLKTPWEGACTIAGVDPQTGEITTLSSEKWDTCYRMEWTRDGSGLVFIGTKAKEALSTRRDQIYYLSLHTGESRRLTTDGSRYQYSSLGVTDNNEILAVPHNRLSQVWTMDSGGDSRTAAQITPGFADGRGGIAPLADGRVAYLTRHGDGFSVWLINADGSDRQQLTTDPPAIEELRAPRDGSFFVFSGKRDGWNHLYRVDSSGAGLKQLTFGDSHEVDSTISNDGKWIVYDSQVFDGNYGRTALWKLPSEGGEPVRLTDTDCHTPHFSPDSTLLSCVSADWKTISIISAVDGTTVRTFEVADNPILNVGAPWTPDGKALAYIVFHKNAGNLRLQPIDGGVSRPLTDFTSGDLYNFAFSPDGSRLYAARGYATRNAVLISNFR